MLLPTAVATPAGLDLISNILPIVIIFGLFYLLILRPQQKRLKEQKDMIAAVGKGDEVVTTGGVLARVVKANDDYLTLEVADGVELVVQRAAIAGKLDKGTIKAQR